MKTQIKNQKTEQKTNPKNEKTETIIDWRMRPENYKENSNHNNNNNNNNNNNKRHPLKRR